MSCVTPHAILKDFSSIKNIYLFLVCFMKVRKLGIQVINPTVSNKLVLFNYIIRKSNNGKWIVLKKTINMYK